MNLNQKEQLNAENIIKIKKLGFDSPNGVSVLQETKLRSLEEIKGRMSVLNAIVNIAYDAPVILIKLWIEKENLNSYLSEWEKQVLETENDKLSSEDLNALRWNQESLWVLMWVTKMVEDLPIDNWGQDFMGAMLPHLQQGEDNTKISILNKMCAEEEVYKLLDFYSRLHWYCIKERAKNKEVKISEGMVFERRKAIAWIHNSEQNWDRVEMTLPS